MKIRQLEDKDLPIIQAVFESRKIGIDPKDSPLPDLSNPLILSKLVVVDDDDNFIAFAYARVTMEIGLVMEPKNTDQNGRRNALEALHATMKQELIAKGADSAMTFLAPVPGFKELLKSYGWEEPKQQLTYLTYSF